MKKDLNSTKEQLSLELNDLRNKSKEREEMQEAANQQLLATEQQLRAANQQLAANNQQLLATEQQLQTSNQQLKERLKELDCLYGISKIVEIPDISLEEIFRRTVKLIPDSWQYPEITVCRIILEGIEYKTHNFNKTKWSQSSDIIIDGKHIGNMEVCYLKEMPDFDEGPFLKEERLLIDALAERLGRITERVLAEEKQKATNQQLTTSEQHLMAANQQLEANNQQLTASEQQLSAANQQLDASNQQLSANEQQLRVSNQQLVERLKELDCFYSISKIVEIPDISLEEIFRRTVKLIPDSWQHPEIAVCRIIFDGIEYKTHNFNKTKWNQSSVIVIDGKHIGNIEVCYLKKMPDLDEGPFLKEERFLIDALAERLGRITQRIQAEEKQRAANQQLDASNQQLSANEQQLRAANNQLAANNQQLTATEQQLRAANQQLIASEHELLKSELILNETGRMAKVGGWELDTKTLEVSWTEETYHIHEIPLGSIPLLEEAINFFHPDDRPKLKTAIKRAIELGEPYDMEIRFITDKGKHLWTHTMGNPVIEDGEIVKLNGVFQDITERKLTEEAMHQYQHIVSSSTDMLALLDKQFTYLAVNKEYCEAFNLISEELIGNTVANVFGEEFFNTVIKPNANRCMRGEEVNYRDWFDFPAYKRHYMDITYYPYYNEDNNIMGFVVNGRNITERKRNEQIQKIIHNISNAANTIHNIDEFIIFIRDELGTIIDTKNFYVALSDDKTETISLLYHQDQKDKLEKFPQGKTLTNYVIKTKKPLLATKAVKDKLVKSGEVELLGKDSKIWLGMPLMIKEKVIGALAVQSYSDKKAFNIKDMQVLEIISNQISISLERKKAEEELKTALEKAQEGDRLKSAFLANMSHEIRTPMNGILGFTGLLKEPKLSGDEKKKFIQVIEKSGDRMLNTINDIIDISKIEAGQVEIVNSEVSVNRILNEQYEFFNPDAQKKGLELNYKPTLSDKEAIIVTDKHKLEGVLTNLIKNAIKFTKHGNISFGYSLKKEKNFEGLEFFIKDTGIGIPSNRISAIFNRFEQADIEDTQVFEGSGLGLAISKSYVEMLGGEISVTSEEGIGSTFVFSIPYTKPTIKERDVEGGINKLPQVSLNKLSAIVAEDDETSRMLLETILENEFHKITYTETGKETVDKFRENPETSIILMDLKMHDMSGYEATREIRKFNQDVVIIAQTAYGLSNDREKAIEAGCDDYISKPFKKELLFEKIMLHLSKRSI